jgi:hypothetical protein
MLAMRWNGSFESLVKSDAFQIVRSVGLGLPGVESATKYDGSPPLKLRGSRPE